MEKRSDNLTKYEDSVMVLKLHGFTCKTKGFYNLLLLLKWDAELNPGPKSSYSNTFSTCHWNLNSIFAYHYAWVFLPKAYVAIYMFGIICITSFQTNL